MPLDILPNPPPPPAPNVAQPKASEVGYLPQGTAKRIPVKYLALPVLIIALSVSIYAVNNPTDLFSFAKDLPCPHYDISESGQVSPKINRMAQISLNGSPIANLDLNKPITLPLPPEGLHSWQVLDDHNCTSAGSYEPSPAATPGADLPLLIPTSATTPQPTTEPPPIP